VGLVGVGFWWGGRSVDEKEGRRNQERQARLSSTTVMGMLADGGTAVIKSTVNRSRQVLWWCCGVVCVWCKVRQGRARGRKMKDRDEVAACRGSGVGRGYEEQTIAKGWNGHKSGRYTERVLRLV
jgi:hypothetical protein